MNILVIGRAKTGTTVISKTIENSIGNTEYFLEPKVPRFFLNQKLASSDLNNIVKIIFEHYSSTPNIRNAIVLNEFPMKFDKQVAIVRDPRDELISRLLFLTSPLLVKRKRLSEGALNRWIKLLKQKESDPRSIGYLQLLNQFNKIFNTRHKYMVDRKYYKFLNMRKLFTIRYEDFIDRKWKQLEEYLGFPLVAENNFGELGDRTRRSQSYNNWKHFFTPRDIEVIQKNYGEMIEGFGYTDWTLAEEPILKSEDHSDYVQRSIAQMKKKSEEEEQRSNA